MVGVIVSKGNLEHVTGVTSRLMVTYAFLFVVVNVS